MNNKRGYYDVLVDVCSKHPSNVAVRVYDDGLYKNYTYSEVYGVCEYLSQNLSLLNHSKGVVGLVTRRNVIVPGAIAAVHKCCTTFMLLDPTQNLESVINKINFKTIIVIENEHTDVLDNIKGKQPDKVISLFDHRIKFFNLNNCNLKQCLSQEDEPSFIAMTSGSTGEPKHIQVPLQCIQPNISDLTKLFDITSEDIIYFSTPLTFDPSMVEILLASTNGSCLLIAPAEPDILFNKNGHSVTFWQTTPSKFFQNSNTDLAQKILSCDTSLKVLALGGEPLTGVRRLKQLRSPDNRTKIFGLYGVTEMSCWACAAELDLDKIQDDSEVPLGQCLSETKVIIEPHREKNKGAIVLVSKTRRCIILNKPKPKDDNSMHRINTGDIGEIKNGTIYYRGRKDDVIKRFGNKVSLQLIETTIMQCPNIKTCSCLWLPKPKLLVVYFSSETCKSQELMDFLKCKLDDKHWPDKIVRVDRLPINKHGKVSKKTLGDMFQSNVKTTEQSLQLSLLTELREMLNKNLTYDAIKNKDFFSIGGTSFLAVSMCNRLSADHPKLGKLILPYLLDQKNTLGDIIQIAHSASLTEELEPRKKIKRSRSNSETQSVNVSKKMDFQQSPTDFVVLWTHDTGKCVDASPTLFQCEFNLYVAVGSHSGQVVVADARSGKVEGCLTLNSRIEASMLCYQHELSPRGIVGTYDGTIVCFSLDNCKQIWKINVGSMIKSKAICSNGFVYVASYDGNVRCIDVTNGDIKQVVHIADQAITADLVLAKNQYILLGTLSGTCTSIHADTKTVAWRGILGSPIFANPVLYDNDKYVVFAEVNGVIHCRTVEMGIKIWKYQGAKGNIFSSIHIKTIGKQKWQMIFGCHDGHVYCVNVKNYQPSLYWKCALTSPVYSTPCLINEAKILAASNNGRLCVINEIGVLISEFVLPEETFSSPAVWGDYIFIGCRNDLLYALKYSS